MRTTQLQVGGRGLVEGSSDQGKLDFAKKFSAVRCTPPELVEASSDRGEMLSGIKTTQRRRTRASTVIDTPLDWSRIPLTGAVVTTGLKVTKEESG